MGRLFALGLLAAFCACATPTDPPKEVDPDAPPPPNIVFLLTDDQNFDSLGCYGNPDVRTPHIDALARDGVAFDRHYVTTAICMASRATIMTGLYEFRHGCNFGHGNLLREHWQNAYPVLLRNAGYRTAMAGKIGFTVCDEPKGKGVLPRDDFDLWGAGPGQTHYETAKNPSIAHYARDYPHATRAYGAFGRDFVASSAEKGEPFCLSISFKAPHRPTKPDPAYDRVYAGKTFRKPANFGRENGAHLAEQSRRGRQYPRFESWGYADRYDSVMAIYHQQVHAIDVAVGMIRDALAEHGVADNTVVIFTSDHGFFCGVHGYGSKVLPYEESTRVPLIVYDPRQPAINRGVRSSQLTGSVDLAPTMLELADVDVPRGIDGVSLLPLLGDRMREVRYSLPLINVWGPRPTHCLAVVTRFGKFVHWPYAGEGMLRVEEVFDLVADPLEMTNCAESRPELLRQLRHDFDGIVDEWKRKAVPYHGYAKYGDWFARLR